MKNFACVFKTKIIDIILLFGVISICFYYMANFTIKNSCESTTCITAHEYSEIADKDLNVISSFTTDYSKSPDSRKYNVRLALKSLNNYTVKGGEELSFNKVVGRRTEERGYKKALVIFKGNYVEGVGGGVCQVSSTLYNAWLLAGLEVTEAKAHSLPASYVDLSRDATVSDLIDMKLKNQLNSDITIKTEYDDNNITIKILGKKREYSYKLKSEVIKTIPYGEEIIELDEIGEDEFFIGKDGYISRLILSIYDKDKVIARKELRRDYYMPQNSVKILRKSVLNGLN